MTVRLATLFAAVCALALGGPAAAAPAVALTGGGDRSLVLFDTASPATFVGVPVTGIAASELLDSVDVRPATGELYGVAVNGGAAQGHLYKIDWGTGVATAVGAPFAFAGAAINSTSMDFNPVVDRVRLVNAAGANVRVDPATGALAGTDTNISPAATVLGDIAYDQNAPGGTATTLYAINTTTDVLSRVGGINGVPSPNGGVLAAAGALGVNPGGTGGFDIAPDGTAYMVNGILFGRVNLTTGAFSLTNQMAINMWGLTILQPSTLAIDPTSATGGEANGAATIAVKRSGPATGTVSVNYATSPGTATPDVDYAPVSGVLSFGPGVTSRTITVPVRTDAVADPGETVVVTLSGPTTGSALGTATSAVTLADQPPLAVPVTAPPSVSRDGRAPAGLLLAPISLSRTQVRRGVALQNGCTEDCTLTLTIRLGQTSLSALTRPLVAGRGILTTLKLSKAGAKALDKQLRTRRRVRVSVVQAVVDVAGNRSVVRRTVVITR